MGPLAKPVRTLSEKPSNPVDKLKTLDQESAEMLIQLYQHPETSQNLKQGIKTHLTKRFYSYIAKIAYGLARRDYDPVDDLIQVGSMGLLMAIEKYNPAVATRFKTYATYYITGEMRHYLRDKVSLIKVPRGMYELYFRMNKIIEALQQQLGRTPSDYEIAQALAHPVETVNALQAMERRKQPLSFEAFMVEEDAQGTVYLEHLVDERNSAMLEQRENRMLIEQALDQLPEELRSVVWLSFFEDKTQHLIAQELGLSQMQVSRRLQKALTQLQATLDPLTA